MLHIRGRLAPAKAEKLIVLKENLDLVEHFKENSLYKLHKSGGHNAFDVIEMEAFAGEGPLEDEEELELYLEDLEAGQDDGEGDGDGANMI